jgi:DNA repair protein SbcD/Mre11
MKIAFTADLHLTSIKDHPERFAALKEILDYLVRVKVTLLVIAGDLFDQSQRDFSEFEGLVGKPEYQNLHIIVIPGNHDLGLSPSNLVARNIKVVDAPKMVPSEEKVKLLLLPFIKNTTMGEAIGEHFANEVHKECVLVSHGDWTGGLRMPNKYEEGIYLPLTKKDIQLFPMRRVILGHIHSPNKPGIVTYTGSPCGIDITETGLRRILMYDTNSDGLLPVPINTDVIFCNESFVILPVEDEEAYLSKKIDARIASWGIEGDSLSKVRLRVSVSGYSSDRKKLAETVRKKFTGFTFYKNEEPDLSGVLLSEDYARSSIASLVMQKIPSLVLPEIEGFPGEEQILNEALAVIYGASL